MTGILFVNMGGPESLQDIKFFLSKMFNDKHILPVNPILRKLLSSVITNLRYKKSWAKYELIGGTPLKATTLELIERLKKNVSDDYQINIAYSYSNPMIKDRLLKFKKSDINKIIVIPLYPHNCFCTTASVESDIKKLNRKLNFKSITVIAEFYKNANYIKFWSELITNHITNLNLPENEKPFIVFSAHSIPEIIYKRGDRYYDSIFDSAKLIMENINENYQYEIAFQSRIGKTKWVGPNINDKLLELKNRNIDNIVLIPISFIFENLETLYDLDREIIPFAKDQLGIKNISRIHFKNSTYLEETLLDLIYLKTNSNHYEIS